MQNETLLSGQRATTWSLSQPPRLVSELLSCVNTDKIRYPGPDPVLRRQVTCLEGSQVVVACRRTDGWKAREIHISTYCYRTVPTVQ